MGDNKKKRDQIHLINDLPHIYEIEDMIEFCRSYGHLYICGAAENQEYLLKYFDICGIKIDGYTVSNPDEQRLKHYRTLPIVNVDEVINMDDTGIIMAISDKHYKYFIPKFRKNGFKNYFLMSEYNKISIANQLKLRPKEKMTFEVNIADHCNMSCQMCDHYSQLADKSFVDMESFTKDIKRMGEIFDHDIACITLLGGEPTLNEDLVDCIRIVRESFPSAQIIILTNGILLFKWETSDRGNLWAACRDYNVDITVTVYPINLDFAALERKAKEYGINLAMSSDIHAEELQKIRKISDKHTFDLDGKVGKEYFISCLYFNKFNVLKEGRYYMCPVAAHVDIFNNAFNQKLPLSHEDSININDVKTWDELAQFSAKSIPFCKYCDLKNWGPHSPWKPSSKRIEEYV
jgi:MoaA/NifB/PqqE/SkfB family radical SAM enzyme